MGYVMSLREKIGHAPIIMTATGVLILDENNRLLLQRRTDNGLWDYPGGSMELGESFEQCAKREVREETGLECQELEVFTIVSGEDQHYIYPNGDEIYAAGVVYLCRRFTGELCVQQEEAFEQRFFALDALPENLDPVNEKTILRLAQMYGES